MQPEEPVHHHHHHKHHEHKHNHYHIKSFEEQDREVDEKEYHEYKEILNHNKHFAALMLAQDPNYFKNLAVGQHPNYLLVGCSDSRVPPEQLVQEVPGEIFTVRNIANQVLPADFNYSFKGISCCLVCCRASKSAPYYCNGSQWLWWNSRCL